MGYNEQLREDGYVFLRNIIDISLVEQLEKLIVDRARIDLEALGKSSANLTPFELLRTLESVSRQRFHKLCSIGTAIAGLQIATSSKITQTVGEGFGRDPSQIFPFPPAVFWNDRPVTRLQYKWHQESSYLEAYKHFLTIWFPLFRDLQTEDGPMIVARGSHKEIFPYSFSKEPNGVTQFSVDDDIADRFEHVPCSIGRGDAVLFHRDLLHKTGENSSGNPRVSVVIRYFDILDVPEYQPMMVPNNTTPKDAVAAKAVSQT
jgi:hypothetical protein